MAYVYVTYKLHATNSFLKGTCVGIFSRRKHLCFDSDLVSDHLPPVEATTKSSHFGWYRSRKVQIHSLRFRFIHFSSFNLTLNRSLRKRWTFPCSFLPAGFEGSRRQNCPQTRTNGPSSGLHSTIARTNVPVNNELQFPTFLYL